MLSARMISLTVDPGTLLPIDPRLVRLGSVFTPATPVQNADLFSGRSELLLTIADAVNQRGMHCILYGERGVGKTSLANILPEVIRATTADEVAVANTSCDTSDTYATLMHKLMQEVVTVREMNRAGFGELPGVLEKPLSDCLSDQPTPSAMRILLQTHPANWLLIVDEFDRLDDRTSIRLISDTIKTLSDHAVPATIVLVGVADSVEELLGEHRSIERCLTQVLMPRMTRDELADIVDRGLAQVDMRVDDPVRWYVPEVSQGYPHFTHLLARHAARRALGDGRDLVSRRDLEGAVEDAITLTERSIRNSYSAAVYSTNPAALYEPVLLACALAQTDELDYFSAQAVRKPLSGIMNRNYDIPAFARHLDAFCQESRGPVLIKEGQPRRYRYCFAVPLLRAFILLKGVADHRITPDELR